MSVFDEEEQSTMLGMHGSVYANYAIQNSDLIITLGSRLDDRITGNMNGHATKAHQAFNESRGGLVNDDNSLEQIKKVKKIANQIFQFYRM